jgi:hypothetical protein
MSAVDPEPTGAPGRPSDMTKRRTFVGAALVGLALVLCACGTEAASDGSSGTTIEPTAQTPSVSADADESDALGTEVLNRLLDVSPAEYPLQDVPTQAEVASVSELAEVYAAAPDIDEIVAELEGTTLGAGDRFFVYLVNACTTDDVSLMLRGDEVPMIVRGTAGLRCPPPTTMVVWVVGDEIPADAKPAPAIQK